MVVRFEHMWIGIPLNLIIVLVVLILMGLTKLWMFNAPRRTRLIPQYSLHVMASLPPDKPIIKRAPNPYYGMTSKPRVPPGKGIGAGALPPKPGATAGEVHNAPHRLMSSGSNGAPEHTGTTNPYSRQPQQAQARQWSSYSQAPTMEAGAARPMQYRQQTGYSPPQQGAQARYQ